MNNNFNNRGFRNSFHSDRTQYQRNENEQYDKSPQRGDSIRSNGNRFYNDQNSLMDAGMYTNQNPGYSYGGQGYGAQTEGHDERWHNVPHADNEKAGFWDKMKSFAGKGPKGYQRSDERIKEDVCEALERDHHVDASEIEVDVKGRIVHLKGQVDSRRTKRLVEDLIFECSGVQDIQNELIIVPAQSPSKNQIQYQKEGDHLMNRLTPGNAEGFQ